MNIILFYPGKKEHIPSSISTDDFRAQTYIDRHKHTYKLGFYFQKDMDSSLFGK